MRVAIAYKRSQDVATVVVYIYIITIKININSIKIQ